MIKFRYISFLFTLMACMILWSCTDFDVVGGSENPAAGNGRSEAILKLNFAVSDGEVRTRDALGNTGVASLWVGVYDITTGNRVGAAHFPNPSGGTVQLPVLYYDEHPTVAIVGVANYDQYDNIYRDWNGVTVKERLDAAETWNDFVNINVKCPTSDNDAPVPVGDYNQIMMGLLTSQDAPRHFVSTDNSGAVNIQNVDPSYYAVTLTSGLYGSMIKEITGKKIYLQRLFSQINVNIKTGSQAEVSNVSFRRCNLPFAVYLAERPTYTGDTKKWGDWSSKDTPNFADTRMSASNGAITNSSMSYYNDSEWQPANRDNTFTFYQYENKHWGWYSNPDNYNSREKSSYGFPEALGHQYNSFASYFVISMNILDKQRGLNAQVEYIIHEGNCNDANGNAYANSGRDYCCFRNMVYNYNIIVNGIEQITYNVTNQNDHHDGNSGVVWTADVISLNNYQGSFTIDGPALYQYGGENVPVHDGVIIRFYVGRGTDQEPLDWIAGKNITYESLGELQGMYWLLIDSNTSINNYDPDLNDRFSYRKRSWWGWDKDTDVNLWNNIFGLTKDDDLWNWGGEYQFHFIPITTAAQWNPEAYKMGIYWYDPMETSDLSGRDEDGCTYYSNKICHVMEWKPAQRQAEQLYLNGNLPTAYNVVNFVTASVVLDFSGISYRTNSNQNLSNQDYEIIVKVNGNEYGLDGAKKCNIPISVLGASNNYSIQAISHNSREFKDSEVTTQWSAITLINPSWDLTTKPDSWYFNGWSYDYEGSKYYFIGPKTVDFYGLSLYCSGSGKKIEWDDSSLNLQNSGTGCDVKFTVYKNCKITIKAEQKNRELHISGADLNEQDMTNKTDDVITTVTMGSDSSREIVIYYTGGGGARIYSISLSDP